MNGNDVARRIGKGGLWVVGAMLIASPLMAQDRSRARSTPKKARAEQTDRVADRRDATQRAARAATRRRANRPRAAQPHPPRREAARQRARRTRSASRRQPASRRSHAPLPRTRQAPAAQHKTASPRHRTQRVRRTPLRAPTARPKTRNQRVRERGRVIRPKVRRAAPYPRRGGISIDIDIAWPWPHRHRRAWRPRYRYKQVVYVEAAWGRHRRAARIDVRTRYHHRVRRADAYRAEVVITIDAIELYADGRYLGTVDRIPRALSRVEATLYRDGGATFDRELFLIGDPRVGFELIATRAHDRPLLGAYRRGDWVRAGAVDLYTGEVVPVRRSRLFRPHAFNGLVPISLLPDRVDWRCDVGVGAISAYPYQEPARYDADPYGEDYYYGASPARSAPAQAHPGQRRRSDRDTFRLEGGAHIELQRTVQLERTR